MQAVRVRNEIFKKTMHEQLEEHIKIMEEYKNVAIDPKRKLLAIGTSEGIIRVYSIRSCSKLKKLEGHKEMVTAMAFHKKGEHLVSYCEKERTLIIWTINASILLFMNKSSVIAIDKYKKKARLTRHLREDAKYPKLEFGQATNQVELYFAYNDGYVFTV